MAIRDLTSPTPPVFSGPGWYTRPVSGCIHTLLGVNGNVNLSSPLLYDSTVSPSIVSTFVNTIGRSSHRTKFNSGPQGDTYVKSAYFDVLLNFNLLKKNLRKSFSKKQNRLKMKLGYTVNTDNTVTESHGS